MKSLFSKKPLVLLRHNWLNIFFCLLLIILVGFVSWKNYIPNTYLVGWDNLHPEFDFKLNIGRSLNAAWQEYQGLGVPGGMGHASEITRQIILWIFSLVLPTNLLRYSWAFLMLLIGPLGMFFLVNKGLLKGKMVFFKSFSGFVSSFFYLFNLGTLQYFYLPYESFLSFYGFLPWLIYAAITYLDSGKKKNLLLFLVISLLATSAFYVQTMFVVFIILLSFFCLESIFSRKFGGLRRAFVLISITLIVNSFWLFPVLYSTFSNSSSLLNSRINSIATPETQIQNIARGDFESITSLKGFWWDYYDLLGSEKYDYLYLPWINYLENPIFQIVSNVLFFVVFIGLSASIFVKKNNFKWSYFGIPLLFTCYFMLATINPPFGKLFSLIFMKFEILSEIFRSVFTKWSMVAAFIYSIGLGYFVYLISLLKNKFLKFISIVVGLLVIVSSIYITKPFFDGKLISERMRINIPVEYFDVFKFFNKEPNNGSVVYLPTHVFWGWYYTDWGYNGSGFLWYGIKQPIIARTFDVWSSYNETFYNEMYKSIYENDSSTFRNIIKKYNVSHLFFDYSEINPGGGGEKVLYLDRIESFIGNIPELEKVFEQGSIKIFRFNKAGNQFISTPGNINYLSSNSNFSSMDPSFKEYGNYVNDDEGINFPFTNLQKGSGTKIVIGENSVKLVSSKINSLDNQKIEIPEFSENEIKFKDIFNPEWVKVENNMVVVEIPIIEWVNEDFSVNRGYDQAKNCDVRGKGEVYKEYGEEGGEKYVLYKATNGGVSCDYVYFPTVGYDQGYLVTIKGENILGRGLKLYLYNVKTGRLDLEEILPFAKPYSDKVERRTKFNETFVIYPKNLENDSGYTLSFETRAFGKVTSENKISNVSFISIPIKWLSGIKIVPNEYSSELNDLVVKKVKKYGTVIYKVNTSGEGLLMLSQGFEKGWLGFRRVNNGWYKLDHVKVNSWANGFIINSNNNQILESEIIIIFWPQLLEWGGFIVLLLTSGGLIVKLRK